VCSERLSGHMQKSKADHLCRTTDAGLLRSEHCAPSDSCPENGDRTKAPEALGLFKTAFCHGT
jgi:hypothetical protein